MELLAFLKFRQCAHEQQYVEHKTNADTANEGREGRHIPLPDACARPRARMIELLDDHSAIAVVLGFWRPKCSCLVTPVPVITSRRLVCPPPHDPGIRACRHCETHQKYQRADSPNNFDGDGDLWNQCNCSCAADNNDERISDEHQTGPKRPHDAD
eukprot:CAMPEP_0185761576 /NCGR_PEP_ID=MMETSP1174-20130828/20512_1 /TAXON_ID=35687 /ORGANISM="Dictyocha speculum, Strain CCMP1381" /LENGTH=155 /DNA_ID=CAMNT_0028442863 /DNA_START=237 /DNA_END=704 /DNA_ORIENTATION=-